MSTIKRAELIAIGSELLTPSRVDTNSLFITAQLNQYGIDVAEKHVVSDELPRLTAAIRESLSRVEFVVLCGGLGPTEDDVTRAAAAAALGRTLVFSEEQRTVLAARFAAFNRKMAENNLRQAYVIEGAEVLPNANGTAPGQYIRTETGALFLLPGPPRELKPMMTEQVMPRVAALVPPQVLLTRWFRLTGMGESDLDTLIAPVYTKYTNPTTTVLSSVNDLSVTLFARSDTEAEAAQLLKEVGDPIAELLGDKVYATADVHIERAIGDLLRERGETVATAESCTGGLIATRLTEYPGSSEFFTASFVTYSDEQKHRLLGIPEELIAANSAVSEPVAAAMAQAAREKTGATYGVSVTGYAGPGGGTEATPAGTVFFGISSPTAVHVRRVRQSALDRTRFRQYSTQVALDLLRRVILNLPLPAHR